MVLAIIVMPELIRGFGPDRYGVMTLAWMLLGYFSLFDLGLGRALTQLVAEKLGGDDEGSIPEIIWMGLLLMGGLGFVGSLMIMAITPWLVNDLLKIPVSLASESRWAFYIMALALPAMIVASGLRGVMEAHQTLKSANIIRSLTSIAILLGPWICLLFTPRLTLAVGAVVAIRVLSCLALAWILVRSIPGMRARPRFRPEGMRPMLKYGGWMTAVNVINPIMVQMDRVLVGSIISITAITYYTTPYELITKGWFLSNCILGVMFPAFATSHVHDRRHTAELLEQCVRYVSLILFPLAIVGMGLAGDILLFWLGADFASASTKVMQWLALGVFFNGVAQVPSALLQGIGRPELTFKIHLAELPFYLAATWYFTVNYGISGTAFAWTCRTAFDLVIYLGVTRLVLPESRRAIWRVFVELCWGTSIIGLIALAASSTYRIPAILVALGAFSGFAWTRFLSKSQRDFLIDAVTHRRPEKASADCRGTLDATS